MVKKKTPIGASLQGLFQFVFVERLRRIRWRTPEAGCWRTTVGRGAGAAVWGLFSGQRPLRLYKSVIHFIVDGVIARIGIGRGHTLLRFGRHGINGTADAIQQTAEPGFGGL